MTLSILDIFKIRKEFPIFQNKKINGNPLIYLDTAATSQKPKKVIDAMSRFYLENYATVHRGIYELSMEATESSEMVRELVKNFIRAKSEREIVFTRGTTDGINLLAAAYRELLQEGDEIIVTEGEHHSNLVPWQLLSQKKKVKLCIVPLTPRGEIDLLQLEKMLNARTKLVSVAHIFNSIGTINPIARITRLAHTWGAKVIVDGAQAVGHTPIDVQDLDADFYVFSAHKAYGPTGVGVLYGKYELLESLPPVQGGGDMIQTVTLNTSTFQPPPLRFEAGTPPFVEVIGLGEALSFIQKVGLLQMEDHENLLLEYSLKKLEEIEGLKILGSPECRSSILSFTVEGTHPLDLGTFLDLKGIAIRTGHHCAQPTMRKFGLTASARISFGIYNTLEEIDTFMEALQDTIYHLKN